MNDRLILAAWFGLGVALQALVLIRGDWNWKRLAGSVCVGLIGMLPGRHEQIYQPFFHVLYSLGIFSCWFAMAFKNDILPLVSEKVLLLYSIVFWFAFFSFFYERTLLHNILLALLMIPTIVTVVIAVVRPKLSFGWKLFLYVWFLGSVISLGLVQFPFHHLSLFLQPQGTPWLMPIDCIMAGMAFLYLAVNITYLYELVPIRGKNQSWQQRMEKWHELTDLMTQRVSEDQPTHRYALLLIAGIGGLLAIDYRFHWLPRNLVINALIILPCILSLGRNSVRAELERRSALQALVQQPGVKIGRNDL